MRTFFGRGKNQPSLVILKPYSWWEVNYQDVASEKHFASGKFGLDCSLQLFGLFCFNHSRNGNSSPREICASRSGNACCALSKI